MQLAERVLSYEGTEVSLEELLRGYSGKLRVPLWPENGGNGLDAYFKGVSKCQIEVLGEADICNGEEIVRELKVFKETYLRAMEDLLEDFIGRENGRSFQIRLKNGRLRGKAELIRGDPNGSTDMLKISLGDATPAVATDVSALLSLGFRETEVLGGERRFLYHPPMVDYKGEVLRRSSFDALEVLHLFFEIERPNMRSIKERLIEVMKNPSWETSVLNKLRHLTFSAGIISKGERNLLSDGLLPLSLDVGRVLLHGVLAEKILLHNSSAEEWGGQKRLGIQFNVSLFKFAEGFISKDLRIQEAEKTNLEPVIISFGKDLTFAAKEWTRKGWASTKEQIFSKFSSSSKSERWTDSLYLYPSIWDAFPGLCIGGIRFSLEAIDKIKEMEQQKRTGELKRYLIEAFKSSTEVFKSRSLRHVELRLKELLDARDPQIGRFLICEENGQEPYYAMYSEAHLSYGNVMLCTEYNGKLRAFLAIPKNGEVYYIEGIIAL